MDFKLNISPLFIPGLTRRDCPLCGSEYLVHHAAQIYCSTRCRAKAHRKRHPGGRQPDITRVGPAIGPADSSGLPAPSATSIPLPLPHNQFSTTPSTAEDDILARWSKKEENNQ